MQELKIIYDEKFKVMNYCNVMACLGPIKS